MAGFIQKPTVIEAPGQPPKLIEEFVGRVNSGTAAVSIARMKSPFGWLEPGQTPEFDEYTVVLRGCLHVKSVQQLGQGIEGVLGFLDPAKLFHQLLRLDQQTN